MASPAWYPRRLIDISKLRERNFLDTKRLVSIDQAHPGHENDRYVTLSHCWGQTRQRLVLTKSEEGRLSNGIRLDELPKTFRHAIELASRLPRVGYVWIDSLCIMQDPDDLSDWLDQSAVMHRVYSESFLNISATAGEHSDVGLFNDRKPEPLWEDDINLNIEGLPGRGPTAPIATKEIVESPVAPAPLGWFSWLRLPFWLFFRPAETPPPPRTNAENPRRSSHEAPPRLTKSGSDLSMRMAESDDIGRCTLIDVSFWDTLVSQAPVNRRGWVLQERLLAPRVLHFCRDQIAWECSEFDAAEGHPPEMPNFQLKSDSIVAESKLKGSDVEKDGARLRQDRLGGDTPDPDPHLIPQGIHAFELWADIVEVYSRTAITNPGDKLIALTGIASWMEARMSKSGKTGYIAGLWDRFLESQLLWQFLLGVC
ncbi:heterokaryon incompatibility protein-domain-containing protein [Cercophora newfieldiana]|uniref:Heterokaryon incompatibility protein-domain-containing protein n=1 Tax=Cercophora newfieldiana TaxID=92897 RepID=A0AA40CQI0_9PEZI|nr:heterokaryon incompatibility protein-domain-containing protein [Cercophora newfieldiana]